MSGWLLSHTLQYAGYILQIALVAFLFRQGRWKRLVSVWLYVSFLLVTDGLTRPYVLYRYGFTSQEYAYFYWLTDVLLALGAFLVICAFFRRACAGQECLWASVRRVLAFVFVLVLGLSSFSLTRNYDHLFSRFITEFQQNLYFTCLVLNTLLFVLIQQRDSADEELGLLVCGLGIQFAGPAANFALMYLTPGRPYAGDLLAFVSPLCTLGMLLTWFYAVARAPKAAEALAGEGHGLVAVEVAARNL